MAEPRPDEIIRYIVPGWFLLASGAAVVLAYLFFVVCNLRDERRR
jgi:hypothetical protein